MVPDLLGSVGRAVWRGGSERNESGVTQSRWVPRTDTECRVREMIVSRKRDDRETDLADQYHGVTTEEG